MTSMFRILLADDEPSIRLALGDALERAGFDVTRVADGEEALRSLKEHAFDLVVTDVSMPKVDGINVFRRVASEHRDTGVILITAFAKVADAVACLKDGAINYVTKPFDMDELLVRVRRVAERRALQRELETTRAQLQGR